MPIEWVVILILLFIDVLLSVRIQYMNDRISFLEEIEQEKHKWSLAVSASIEKLAEMSETITTLLCSEEGETNANKE